MLQSEINLDSQTQIDRVQSWSALHNRSHDYWLLKTRLKRRERISISLVLGEAVLVFEISASVMCMFVHIYIDHEIKFIFPLVYSQKTLKITNIDTPIPPRSSNSLFNAPSPSHEISSQTVKWYWGAETIFL